MKTNNIAVPILVVDDEPGMRELLSMEFTDAGYEVVMAADGHEALELFKQQKFNLVITDMRMPRMGGMELLEKIKKENTRAEVIIATGFGLENAGKARTLGAYDFIQKPYDFDHLLRMAENALEKANKRGSQDENTSNG